MKSFFLLITFSILLLAKVNAQQIIAVQNGNSTLLYNNLDSAILHAQNGDTIYLPGGSFSLTLPISKRLYIVGVGHNPDSTTATSRTIVNGQLTLQRGSNYGLITGVYFSGTYSMCCPNIRSENNISNYTISRCYLSNGIMFDSLTTNFTIRESVIGSYCLNAWCGGTASIYGPSSNLFLTNNIILNRITAVENGIIKNNIFLADCCSGFCSSLGINGSLVENNIINCSNYLGSNSIYKNNINQGVNGSDGYGNQGNGNFFGIPMDSIFVNSNSEIYTANFDLKGNSPYQNAGTDGTDIGIYGGSSPWKEGSIPFNPHISSKNIDSQNDANGNIRVRIKVKAQSN